MKAVRFHRHGGPEVLICEEVPDPAPPPGWAVVRVRAYSLNHLDLWHRNGIARQSTPLPLIGGSDVSGEVVDPGASGVKAGTRVMLQPGISCGHCAACISGRDNECRSYSVLGTHYSGGAAELVTVPPANLVPIPDTIGFVEAAAFPLTFLTAWHMMLTRARLQAGETVLVLAAGSGVGQAAIQLARLHNARVLATAGSDEKATRGRELGAEAVINHHTEDLPARVRELTGGRGVDVVIEHVGQATWDRSLKCLAPAGRLVTCGATAGYDAKIDLRFLFARQLSLLGSYMGRKEELLRAAQFLCAGRMTPVIDRTFPLHEAPAAHERLEKGEHFGKIVLTTA